MAPGTAFGPGAERHLRLCFARSADSLNEAVDRLTEWLKR
jgi:aspartate/methionine/tyrosine aminotransferase